MPLLQMFGKGLYAKDLEFDETSEIVIIAWMDKSAMTT